MIQTFVTKDKTEIGSAEEQPIRDILLHRQKYYHRVWLIIKPFFKIFLEMPYALKNLSVRVVRPLEIHL